MLRFDVRDQASFNAARMAGAQHLTQRNLSELIAGTNRRTAILIYCYHGHASQEYAQTFSDFGFTEVYSLDGGYEAWRLRFPARNGAAEIGPTLAAWLTAQGFPADDVDAIIDNRTTPLMKAAHLGNITVIRELLAAGAAIAARNADGNNALWLACVGRHLEAIDALVEAGIDVDNCNDNGATALMYASSSGKDDVVAHLLAKGADITTETLDGFSALDMAASLECLTLLRQAAKAAARSAPEIRP
ncbi:putative thiosulfate sulfurtransferase; Rhodanese-like domain/ankyrin repeat domain protein [Bradyrhizobium sp. ORS 278]|uniref:ankyrin repeat domain-containing protein n=1 Tax=Bradyrhizobium sp. (strain ORS 278) TaxID=114615 RepID=UPI0001507C0D|nr:ankyrin repeat domain-containing protein [Bradyrhizobium sp. ORS 278]CAL75719.1 putative thiosulfate sulfurtransferase; Rhodanese-like domain/ankyrin repeat domain protein [Bradyrhizobium sp. ORS 278]